MTSEQQAEKARLINRILDEAARENLFNHEELQAVKQALEDLSYDELIEEYLPRWMGELYRWEPVPVREWLYSEEYMNLEGQIWPILAEDFIEMMEGGYKEAVIEGSIGWGKSFVSGLALTRMIYELSCYKDPQLALGLARGSQIVLVNIATKEQVAKEVVFGYVQQFVRGSRYFLRNFPADKDLVKELKFPNHIRVVPAASTQGSVIGQNVYGAVLDEANFLFKGESSRGGVNQEYDLAKVLWNALQRRISSRFKRQSGILLTVSSSMYPNDFTKWRKEEADKTGERIFYRRYSQWEPKPVYQGFDKDPNDYFWLSIGDANHRPRILRSPDDEDYDERLDDRQVLEEDGLKVIKVPEDFRLEFERDIDMAVRDIAGYATQSKFPFFRNLGAVQDAIERGKKTNLQHPWTLETTTLRDRSSWLKDKLDFKKRVRHHFAHVDLGLSHDAAGIAIVRLDGIEEEVVERPVTNSTTFEVTVEEVRNLIPKMSVVMMLRVVSNGELEVPLKNVRQILVDLVMWGFNLTHVTYDQYQSAESVQTLQNLGVEAGYLSVDRTIEPYNSLKEAFDDERIAMYPFPHVVKEMSELELDLDRKKVDHPPRGSKDVADGLAGAVHNCTVYVRDNESILVPGETGEDDDVVPPTYLTLGEDPDDELNDISWIFG